MRSGCADRKSRAHERVADRAPLLARVGEWKALVLRGPVSCPDIRADGAILQAPGFGQAAGLPYHPGGTVFEQGRSTGRSGSALCPISGVSVFTPSRPCGRRFRRSDSGSAAYSAISISAHCRCTHSRLWEYSAQRDCRGHCRRVPPPSLRGRRQKRSRNTLPASSWLAMRMTSTTVSGPQDDDTLRLDHPRPHLLVQGLRVNDQKRWRGQLSHPGGPRPHPLVVAPAPPSRRVRRPPMPGRWLTRLAQGRQLI